MRVRALRGSAMAAGNMRFSHALIPLLILLSVVLCAPRTLSAGEVRLDDLLREALEHSPQILSAEAHAAAAYYRIPQSASLPDPMFMLGYQNEGFERYMYGKSPDAQWMFSLSQMFPFPGKLPLRETMTTRESEALRASSGSVRLKTIARIKELFFQLFLAYKLTDLVEEKSTLFLRIEEAAVSRYATGMGSQQEVLMAQTEKFMLLEREEMLHQKIQALEAMLNRETGRTTGLPLGRPSEPSRTEFVFSIEELLAMAHKKSPDIRMRERMVAAAETKVLIAEKEYYPDFTLTANLSERRHLDDMWSLTTAVSIPVFYRTKQRQAVHESEASLAEARSALDSMKLEISSEIRDNHSMLKTAQKLMDLYRSGLLPKAYQDFELALAGYRTGKTDALTVISRLKSVIEFETSYWEQFIGRERAIARLEALAGITNIPQLSVLRKE